MIFAPFLELFLGEWECVVATLAKGSNTAFIVCHKHTVTKRVKGYVDFGGVNHYPLETHVVHEHIATYGKKA